MSDHTTLRGNEPDLDAITVTFNARCVGCGEWAEITEEPEGGVAICPKCYSPMVVVGARFPS